jgi:hypothetical protein
MPARRYRAWNYRATQKLIKALELVLRYTNSAISRATDDTCIPETMQDLQDAHRILSNALRRERASRGYVEIELVDQRETAMRDLIVPTYDLDLPPEASDAPEIPDEDHIAWPQP